MAANSDKVRAAFAAELRRARLEAGLSQLEVASQAEYEPVYISNLEAGRYQPSLTAVLSLERALSLSPGTLAVRTAEAMLNQTGANANNQSRHSKKTAPTHDK